MNVQNHITFNRNRLKVARIERGVSAAEIAKALGISTVSYYKKESGPNAVTTKDLAIIMEVLGMKAEDASYFFTNIYREEEEGP